MSITKSPLAALVAWAVAVALALTGRQLLDPSPEDVSRGWLLYGLAGLLLVTVGLGALGSRRAQATRDRMRFPTGASRRVAVLAVLGAAFSCAAFGLVMSGRAHAAHELVWLAGVASLTLAALAADRATGRPRTFPRLRRRDIAEGVALIAIFAVALLFRLPELEAIPRDVHGDEALVGLDAREFLSGENRELFTVGFAATPRLSYAIPALSMSVFGDDLFGLRLASVLLGVASVVLTYLLTRHLFGVRTAVTASLLLAVAQWHVHFSRSGISNIQATVVTLLVLFFVVRACERGRWLDCVVAGFAMALSLQVYQAGRLAPFLAAAYVVHRGTVERGFFRKRWPGLVVIGLAALVMFAPMGAYFWGHREELGRHSRDVWIFSPGPREHLLRTYGADGMAEVVLEQSERTLAALNGAIDTYTQYHGRLTDAFAGPLVLLGLVLSLVLTARESRHFLLALWLVASLLVAVLTVNAVFSARLVAATPAFAIAGANVLVLGWDIARRAFGGRGDRAFLVAVCGLVCLIAYVNYRDYFVRHRETHPAEAPTVLARSADAIDERYRIYLLPGGNIPLTFETVRFLAPSLDGRDLTSSSAAELAAVPADKGAAFVVFVGLPETATQVAAVRATYPDARLHRLGSAAAAYFEVLLVERHALGRRDDVSA